MSFGPQTFSIGELDQRVTIQELISTPDGAGGYLTKWSDVATVWAKVRPRASKEAVGSDRVEGSAVYMFVMRYRSIDERNRFMWKGVPFNVRPAMDHGPRSLYIVVDAEKGVAQ